MYFWVPSPRKEKKKDIPKFDQTLKKKTIATKIHKKKEKINNNNVDAKSRKSLVVIAIIFEEKRLNKSL